MQASRHRSIWMHDQLPWSVFQYQELWSLGRGLVRLTCYTSHIERECWWGRIRVLPLHVILLFQFGEVKTFSLSWRTQHYGVWSHLLSRSGDEFQHFKAKGDREKSWLSKDLKKKRNVSQWACLLYGDFPFFSCLSKDKKKTLLMLYF